MYIALKTTNNTDKIIQDFLRNNVAIDVRKHDILTFLEANLKDYGYVCYCRVSDNCLVILSLTTHNELFAIPFEEINTLYEF